MWQRFRIRATNRPSCERFEGSRLGRRAILHDALKTGLGQNINKEVTIRLCKQTCLTVYLHYPLQRHIDHLIGIRRKIISVRNNSDPFFKIVKNTVFTRDMLHTVSGKENAA